MPRDWKRFGDRRERRRLIRDGRWYDPENVSTGEQLTLSIRNLIGDRWANGRPWKIEGDHVICFSDFIAWLVRGAAGEVVPGIPGAPCERWARAADVALWLFGNNERGPGIAAWWMKAKPLNWHGHGEKDPPHAFILALTEDRGWLVFDVAFSSNPDPARWIYPVGADDGGFGA